MNSETEGKGPKNGCFIKSFLGAALIGVAAFALPSAAPAQIGIYIGRTPPPLRREVRPAMPGPGYAWVDGFWEPYNGNYRWHPGYWNRPPYEGAYWSHPHYDHYQEGWQFHEGHWDHEDHGDHHFDGDRH